MDVEIRKLPPLRARGPLSAVACALFLLAAPAEADGSRATRSLSFGEVLEAELQPGAEDRYRLAAPPRGCAVIEVLQTDVNVRLEARERPGAPPIEESQHLSGTELWFVLPSVDPAFELTVSASDNSGSYRIGARQLAAGAGYLDACRQEIAARAAQDLDQKLAAHRSVRESWLRLGEEAFAAHASNAIGSIAFAQSDLPTARAAFAEAARAFGALGLVADQADAQHSLIIVHELAGDYRAASALLDETLEIAHALRPHDRIDLWQSKGLAFKALGDSAASIEWFEKTADAFHALGYVRGELLALQEIGGALMFVDPVRGLEVLTRGLELSRAAGDVGSEAAFVYRIGVLYWEAGAYDTAVEHLQRAHRLFLSSSQAIEASYVSLMLGDYQGRQGRFTEAAAIMREALDTFRHAGAKEGEQRALARLGRVLVAQEDFTAATEVQQQALDLCRSLGNKRTELINAWLLGQTKARAGERAAARALLTNALALARDSGDGPNEFRILADLARLEGDDGQMQQALANLDAGIRRAEEEQRGALVPGLKATLGSAAQPLYAARTELLMRRHLEAPDAGWDARALETAERKRGRALLALLAESKVDLRQGVDPARLDRYRVLQTQLAEADRVKDARGSDARPIAEILTEIDVLEAKIRKSSPAFAALAQPSSLSLAEIQKNVLDERTVLIEYALGPSKSWVFAVTKEELVSAPLPAAETIERAARKLYQAWSALPAAASVDEPARELGRMLLEPLTARLGGPWRGHRLVIVSEGALDYIPFAALPLPGAASPAILPRLIEDHEIVRIPSATVLAVMRRSNAGRRPAPRRLALVGDPVFQVDDPRVKAGAAPVRSSSGTPAAAGSPAPLAEGASGFQRLPFSREEVREIAALVPPQDVLLATDFQASRERVLDGTLGRYRMIHLATHGLLNTAHPELSGIVLSLVDEAGRPRDGFLRLQDIYNLRLAADLVVLSGCRTALGREIAGEGFIGLTRGFMYAGTPRVVASSWRVDDDATAALMRAFYSGMLEQKLTPAAALRAAQRSVSREKRWSSPYFWAGFTLVGDWR